MTTPTQAQIITRTIKESELDCSEWDIDVCAELAMEICAALTTAAQQQMITNITRAVFIATIERCAQVAEADTVNNRIAGQRIAAAIRKLKDEAHTAAKGSS